MLIKNIQVFISFVKFYQCFNWSFSKIAILLSSLFKIIKFLNLILKALRIHDNKVVELDGRTNKTIINLFKNSTYIANIRAKKKFVFLTPNAEKAFNYLWLTFIKAQISQHFNLESHIYIKIDASSYAIDRVLS